MLGIKPAQRVRIGVEAPNGQILQFYSYIKQIMPDRLRLIYSKKKEVYTKYLDEGALLKLSIYTPGGIVLLSSIVLEAPEECEFEVEFSPLKNAKRIQRRKYVRAVANYRVIIEQDNETFTGLTQDIGGGGVRFVCDSYICESEVTSKLFLPGIGGINIKGDVLKQPHYKPNEYLLLFTGIEESDRSKIIQKCLEIETRSITPS